MVSTIAMAEEKRSVSQDTSAVLSTGQIKMKRQTARKTCIKSIPRRNQKASSSRPTTNAAVERPREPAVAKNPRKKSSVVVNEPADNVEYSLPTAQEVYSSLLELVKARPRAGASSRQQGGGASSKVRETLQLFQGLVKKIQQAQETAKEKGRKPTAGKRPDVLAASLLREDERYINQEKLVGEVPGVALDDFFNFRFEIAAIGLHGPLQGGIDTVMKDGVSVAISVVASGGYDNDVADSDTIIYTGHGGNLTDLKKPAKDQILEAGNLGLSNCVDTKSPVRLIRGFKRDEIFSSTTYIYDGLYTVVRYWTETGPRGKLVYKFELRRVPNQKPGIWKEITQQSMSSDCVLTDISGGQEAVPIPVVNAIDDQFSYISNMMYSDVLSSSSRPSTSTSVTWCTCEDGCSDSKRCACVVRNGGAIPYTEKGLIVLPKPLVYECGPHCKCPPSCSNRVSQHGIKLPLQLFKTETTGWGVRCRTSIVSGTFISEYVGELLEDYQAEAKEDSDEYLFDIGRSMDDGAAGVEGSEANFTIDALRFGNIARFINHSCSPNLYAQNVIYDHDDKRVPHIMLFAAENIPPLRELSYDYNYEIGSEDESVPLWLY